MNKTILGRFLIVVGIGFGSIVLPYILGHYLPNFYMDFLFINRDLSKSDCFDLWCRGLGLLIIIATALAVIAFIGALAVIVFWGGYNYIRYGDPEGPVVYEDEVITEMTEKEEESISEDLEEYNIYKIEEKEPKN
jgi:hypothetical protein